MFAKDMHTVISTISKNIKKTDRAVSAGRCGRW